MFSYVLINLTWQSYCFIYSCIQTHAIIPLHHSPAISTSRNARFVASISTTLFYIHLCFPFSLHPSRTIRVSRTAAITFRPKNFWGHTSNHGSKLVEHGSRADSFAIIANISSGTSIIDAARSRLVAKYFLCTSSLLSINAQFGFTISSYYSKI